MSSETINVIDHLTKNLNNHKAVLELEGGTGRNFSENGKTDGGKALIPAAKKHFEPAKIIESNKKFKHAMVNELNRFEEKEEFKKGITTRELHSQGNNNKQLSFFHSDDEGASDSRSNSPEQISHSKCSEVKQEEEIILIHDDCDVDCASKDSDVKVIESHQDDASSTSSCSCEDHSSVASPDLDPHVDLDYDEDSITGSSNEVSNGNSKQTRGSNSVKLPCKPSKLQDSTKNTPNIISDNNNSGIRRTSQSNELALTEGEQVDEDSDEELSEIEKGNKTRIKSFINYNHIHHNENDIQEELGKTSLSNRSTKSYKSLLKYFFKDTCYFQIKSINHENVEISKSMGVWSTPIQNELRLNAAFREHRNVILIFSVQQSGAFQGFARMVSEARPSSRPVPWILPERLSNKSLGGVMKLEWLCTKELQFHNTLHLLNPYNDNRPIKIARDGQQVEPRIGKKLCKLFPENDRNRLLDCITTLKHQTSQRKKTSIRYDNYYPFVDRPGFVPVPYKGRHRHEFPPGHHPPPPPHFMGPNDLFVGFDTYPPMDDYIDSGFDGNPAGILRNGGRERVFNHSNHHRICHHQNLIGQNNFPVQLRHQHPQQAPLRPNTGLPARYMMSYSESGSHLNSGSATDHHKPPHHHSSPPIMWSNSNSPSRYHPYQRFRR